MRQYMTRALLLAAAVTTLWMVRPAEAGLPSGPQCWQCVGVNGYAGCQYGGGGWSFCHVMGGPAAEDTYCDLGTYCS